MNIIKKDEKLIRLLVDFFVAKVNNEDLYKEIKKVTFEKNRIETAKLKRLRFDYFDTDDFAWFVTQTGRYGADGVKIDVHHLDSVFDELAQYQILKKPGSIFGGEQIYTLNYDSVPKELIQSDLIINLIMGWQYTVNRYSNSVFKIEHIANGDSSIGTGFLYQNKNVVITNAHCVDKAEKINVYDVKDNPVAYNNIVKSDKYDLAAIHLEKEIAADPLTSSTDIEILAEVVTIGYPSIPLTKLAYQVIHKGEINAFVEDYYGQDYIVFSAKTSSGNSGSPLINKAGQVIGVVASELFEKEAFFEKGKLPYYGAIPSTHLDTLLK
jgi:S1-C subfamily serine protease